MLLPLLLLCWRHSTVPCPGAPCTLLAHLGCRVRLRSQEYDGKSSDVWSLGVVLFVMLTGRHPFTRAALKANSKRVASADRVRWRVCAHSYHRSSAYHTLLVLCCCLRWVLPAQSECLMPPLSTSLSPLVCDLLKALFRLSPDHRPKLSEVARHPWCTQSRDAQHSTTATTPIAPPAATPASPRPVTRQLRPPSASTKLVSPAASPRGPGDRLISTESCDVNPVLPVVHTPARPHAPGGDADISSSKIGVRLPRVSVLSAAHPAAEGHNPHTGGACGSLCPYC